MSQPDSIYPATVSSFPCEEIYSLAENIYCLIHQARCHNTPVVLKKYISGEGELVVREAEGLQLYLRFVSGNPAWLDCELLYLDKEARVFVMGFVTGIRLSDYLYGLDPKSVQSVVPQLFRRLSAFLG